ncbi:MAG: hypothetical protein MK135_09530 [Polyangiaceae bacterium]|nr:hypothetical protein [Polyangiaceae bacterium]
MMKKLAYFWGSCAALAGITACSSEGGDLDVLVEAEDVITDGIQAGSETENIRDGWNVEFDKYLVAIGKIDIQLDGADVEAEDVYLVDLKQVPQQGTMLWSLLDLDEGRWDFSYATTHEGMQQGENVADADFEEVTENEWTYKIEGHINQEEGVSCPPTALAEIPEGSVEVSVNDRGDSCYAAAEVSFSIGAQADTNFGPCEVDGLPGVVVTAGQASSTTLTIHGDHIFFNGFPAGSEGGVIRLAQWLADADLNLDGKVDVEELKKIAPSDLLDPDVYNLGGSPITPLDNMFTYVQAQLKTQGHYQGEGECPVDGVEHDHGHDDHDHDDHGDEDHDDHGDEDHDDHGDEDHDEHDHGDEE